VRDIVSPLILAGLWLAVIRCGSRMSLVLSSWLLATTLGLREQTWCGRSLTPLVKARGFGMTPSLVGVGGVSHVD